MRVLIIGTTGQLARELHREPALAEVTLVPAEKVDLADAPRVQALVERAHPQLIINAAAYTAVDRAETESERAYAINEHGPATLAAQCAQRNIPLFHVSTDYVFDGSKRSAYVETDATTPLGVYGASKLAGELQVRRILERHLIVRTSWVFSAHGQNFVKTMLRLAAERDELRVVADQHGRPTAAAALAKALLTLARRLARGDSLPWGTYHFAGRGETTWHGFASAIVEAQGEYTKRRPIVTPIATSDYPTPAKRPQNSVLDTTRFENLLGITPPAWREGLDAVLRELLHT